MKKLFLIAATSTALLTSATSFAETGGFYLKAEGGAAMLNKEKAKLPKEMENLSLTQKVKRSAVGVVGLGAGYYAMDNVRAELTLDFLPNIEFKDSITVTGAVAKGEGKLQGTLESKRKGQVISLLLSGYVDLYDAGFAKFFAGAGVGMAQIKEKATLNGAIVATHNTIEVNRKSIDISTKSKNSNNFAYQLSVGASANVADGINVELAYSWRDYGAAKYGKGKESKSESAYRGHHLMAGLRFDL
ncbi:outer membrane protein [Candidatus Tisiphia endosymbiont of Temnostethus pusillus]|uniref:outer membrane protein n=1 Tax=Candidatus Tisiphia endosymbiont of Temnostethus pusillus TaxID=3139335 RepID=UPI0035C88D04